MFLGFAIKLRMERTRQHQNMLPVPTADTYTFFLKCVSKTKVLGAKKLHKMLSQGCDFQHFWVQAAKVPFLRIVVLLSPMLWRKSFLSQSGQAKVFLATGKVLSKFNETGKDVYKSNATGKGQGKMFLSPPLRGNPRGRWRLFASLGF